MSGSEEMVCRFQKSRMRKKGAGALFSEAALAAPLAIAIIFFAIEPVAFKMRADRVQRILDKLASQARGDIRLQRDVWTAGSGSVPNITQFNKARAELGIKFETMVSQVGGVTPSTVGQLIPGAGYRSQKLLFLPPGASGEVLDGQLSGKNVHNSFHCDPSKRGDGGFGRRGSCDAASGSRPVDTSDPSQALSVLSRAEPTEMAAVLDIKGVLGGLVPPYSVLLTTPYYPLLKSTPARLAQCVPQNSPPTVTSTYFTGSWGLQFLQLCGLGWPDFFSWLAATTNILGIPTVPSCYGAPVVETRVKTYPPNGCGSASRTETGAELVGLTLKEICWWSYFHPGVVIPLCFPI